MTMRRKTPDPESAGPMIERYFINIVASLVTVGIVYVSSTLSTLSGDVKTVLYRLDQNEARLSSIELWRLQAVAEKSATTQNRGQQ